MARRRHVQQAPTPEIYLSVDVEADGQVHRCSFALASRVKNYGVDLSIARDVSLFDDDFELVLFQGPSSLTYIKYIAGVMLNSLKGMKGVMVLRANSITFGSPADPDLHVQIVQRIHVGSYVIDEEKVTGFNFEGFPSEMRTADIYWVEGQVIVQTQVLM